MQTQTTTRRPVPRSTSTAQADEAERRYAAAHAVAKAWLHGVPRDQLRALFFAVDTRLEATMWSTTAETATIYDPEALACRHALIEATNGACRHWTRQAWDAAS